MFFVEAQGIDEELESLGVCSGALDALVPYKKLEGSIRVFPERDPRKSIAMATWIATTMGQFRRCMLCVTRAEDAMANAHLYYRIRQSYHDWRECSKAPGHVFLGYEYSELRLFLDLMLQLGWECYVVSDGAVRFFLANRTWFRIAFRGGVGDDERDRVMKAISERRYVHEIE